MNIVGTKRQVHKTRKQKVISKHTKGHMTTFKPESQFHVRSIFPWRSGVYTQSVEDDFIDTMKSTPDLTSCGRHSLRPSMYMKAGCLIRKQGTMIRSVIPLPYISSTIPRTLCFALSKITNQTIAKVSQTPSSRSLAFPSHGQVSIHHLCRQE